MGRFRCRVCISHSFFFHVATLFLHHIIHSTLGRPASLNAAPNYKLLPPQKSEDKSMRKVFAQLLDNDNDVLLQLYQLYSSNSLLGEGDLFTPDQSDSQYAKILHSCCLLIVVIAVTVTVLFVSLAGLDIYFSHQTFDIETDESDTKSKHRVDQKQIDSYYWWVFILSMIACFFFAILF